VAGGFKQAIFSMSGKPLPLACCRFWNLLANCFFNPLKTMAYIFYWPLAQALLCCR
jgi:hypothetical protein